MTPRVYYNDDDPFCLAWLRALIAAGELPEGELDGRSIRDVSAADLRGFDHCHFFAGIGGWPYALRLADWPPEREAWTGSCPCGPYSASGKGLGAADPRDLWPAWSQLLRERRPAVVFGEQVASADGLGWFDRVAVDLERCGLRRRGGGSLRCGHRRADQPPRLFIVAQSLGPRLEGQRGHGDDRDEPGRLDAEPDRSTPATGAAGEDAAGLDAVPLLRGLDLHDPRRSRRGLRLPADRAMADGSLWSRFEQVACADGWRLAEPGVFPLADGVPSRVGRLRAYGNAIVPPLGAAVVRAYLEVQPC